MLLFKHSSKILLSLCLCAACAHTKEATAQTNKKHVLVLATGGTIAGQANPNSAIGYDAGVLTAKQLVDAIPQVNKVAVISTEQVSDIPSQDMNDKVWHKLGQRILKACHSKSVDGIVITHGTDTLEETAFFLDQVVPQKCTVILTAAMRPSSYLSADGPANLFEAIKVAADKSSQHRGVLIVLNNDIHAARWATKTNTTSVETFQSLNQGPVGYVDQATVRFITASPKHKVFPLPASEQLPEVEIIYAHSNMGDKEINFLVQSGAKGIVVAGVGDGNLSQKAIAALKKAHKSGVLVVRSSRVGSGFTNRNVEVNDDQNGFLTSYDLNPPKARILAQLLIVNNGKKELTANLQKAFYINN